MIDNDELSERLLDPDPDPLLLTADQQQVAEVGLRPASDTSTGR